MAGLILYRWRVTSDGGPWKQRPGTELRWEMTEADAAKWQASNPKTIIEKVPGSANERRGYEFIRPPFQSE